MIVIKDSSDLFTLSTSPYIDLSIIDLFLEMMSIKRANCPKWTDESETDFGNMLMFIQAVLAQWMANHAERVKNNNFISSVEDREHLRRLCELINYQLSEGAAASVKVTFVCVAGHPGFTIPKGTQIRTQKNDDDEYIIFETNQATVVSSGISEVEIECTQGILINNEIIGSSISETNQLYQLSQNPVVWHSETVQIYDGVSWVSWTRVDNFVNSGSNDKHYRIENDSDGIYYIVFGDGINGKIPIRGSNNIRASYIVGGGADGNVASGAITEIVDTLTYVESVINNNAASGGMDRETPEHAKLFAPARIKTMDKLINKHDAETLADTFQSTLYGGIAKSKAIETGGNSITIMIVPKSGGHPSTELKNEFLAYLNDRRLLGTIIRIKDPDYTLIDISADIYILSNYAPSQVAQKVRNRLVALISPTYQDPSTGLYPHDFGRNVYLSDIISVIDATDGVDYVNLSIPSENVIINDYRIADIGDINLTIHSDQTDDFHYSTMRDDLINSYNRNILSDL